MKRVARDNGFMISKLLDCVIGLCRVNSVSKLDELSWKSFCVISILSSVVVFCSYLFSSTVFKNAFSFKVK